MNEVKLKTHTGSEITFTTEISGYDEKLIISMFGPDGTGKSRFPVTGPTKHGLVGIVPTDRKTRLTALKAAEELGKKGRILLPKEDLVREVNPTRMGWSATATETEMEKKTKEHYRKHVDHVKEIAWALHANKDVTLIAIDLAQQLYQDIKYAHYGRTEFLLRKVKGEYYKDTKEADQEFIDFLNSLSDKHLILTHKAKDEYLNDKATGNKTEEGYKYIGNHVNMRIEMHNNLRWNPNSDHEDKNWHFAASIRRCQWNIEVEGDVGEKILKDEFVTFQALAMAVFPNSKPEDWE